MHQSLELTLHPGTIRLGVWTSKTRTSLVHWTSGLQNFFLTLYVFCLFIIIDQDSRPMGEATREKPKIGDKDQHVGADERNDTDAGIDIINAHNLYYFNLITFFTFS